MAPAPAPPPPPTAGPSRPTPLFEQSSQFRHWRFSKDGLDQARRELNEGAIGRVRAKVEEERETDPTHTSTDAPATSAIEYLTVEDEGSLVTFYLTKISQLCRASFFRFPETVEATAMTYLKRFYLRNTCMDYHPKNVMLTCLFLATKTENTSISIDAFSSRIPKTSNDDVLALEFLVAQSLRFEFKVHHPHHAAKGILLDLQNSSIQPPPTDDLEGLKEKWGRVREILGKARLGDAEFLWTPSQVAAAAWLSVDEELTRRWIEAKGALASKVEAERAAKTLASNAQSNKSGKSSPKTAPPHTPTPPAPTSLDTASLLTALEPVRALLSTPPTVNKDAVTAVDRRLRFCKNPEKDPSSVLFKKKEQQDMEKQREKKRLKELGEQRRFGDDPFGGGQLGPGLVDSTDVDMQF